MPRASRHSTRNMSAFTGPARLRRAQRKRCSRPRSCPSSGSSPSRGVTACRTRAFCYFGSTKMPCSTPLKQFEHFLCRSLVAPRPSAPWAKATILGPSFSTTLQAMVDEGSNKSRSSLCPDSARPEFYVNSATADDPTLISDYISRGPPCLRSDTCLQDFFAENGIKLYRMIATDQALALAIRGELRLRGVDDKASHIALVSEWDTLYGRALPDSIARCFGEDERNGTSGTTGC